MPGIVAAAPCAFGLTLECLRVTSADARLEPDVGVKTAASKVRAKAENGSRSIMRSKKPRGIAFLIALLVMLAGCGGDGFDTGPLGTARPSVLLAPFAGNWVFDFDRTLDTQQAAGASKEDIERLRKLSTQNPQFGKLHADMVLTGNQAVCSGVPSAEYDFLAMHHHDGKLCGKAWHHEDRHDPGDMSKCYVRMAIVENRLLLEVKMSDGSPDLNDPDLVSSPPVDLDSAALCDADKPAGGAWSPWTTYVFARR